MSFENFEDYVRLARASNMVRVLGSRFLDHPICVLDIGTGLYGYRSYFNPQSVMICVDQDKRVCDLLRFQRNVTVLHEDFATCDLQRLRDVRYDLILLNSVLHLVEDPEQILARTHGLADRNTYVYITVPNARSVHKVIGNKMADKGRAGESKFLASYHRHSFRMEDLVGLVSKRFQIFEKGSYLLKTMDSFHMMELISQNPSLVDGIMRFDPEHEIGCELWIMARKTR